MYHHETTLFVGLLRHQMIRYPAIWAGYRGGRLANPELSDSATRPERLKGDYCIMKFQLSHLPSLY